jgi:hypothetical protein
VTQQSCRVGGLTDTNPVFWPESPIPAPLETRYYSTRSTMTARGRPAYTALPPMPLSELPMMKALLTSIPGGAAIRNPSAKGDAKARFTMLRLAIIDKLQVLALRRPQALVLVAQVLDALLNEQLKVLGEQRNGNPPTKARDEASRTADRGSGGRYSRPQMRPSQLPRR